MDAVARETLLTHFGISQQQNDEGKLIWSIHIQDGEANPRSQPAYFDEQLKVWRLHSVDRSRSHSTPESLLADRPNVSQPEPEKSRKSLTTELSESERRASRMAEIVPVGIYELSADGLLHWANNQFFDLMGVPQDHRNKESFSWAAHILPEDHARANEKMAQCLLQGLDISDTLRLRRDWNPPKSELDLQPAAEPFWVMYSASPFLRADGSISSLIGSITDISHLKWAEQLQLRNAEAAQKERRIQEEFIDITSHEMRNPLSAITQSADGVLLSLQDARALDSVDSLMEVIRSNAEAAESILFCAAHQRRIIDDILTLGKLDSNLLAMFPSAFRLGDLIDQTMQMFRAEFEANKLKVETVADAEQGADDGMTIFADPSRLLQVLVNIMTNAIKFTKTQRLRTISIKYGSTSSRPPARLFGPSFKWHCTNLPRPDLTEEAEYGQGESMHIYVAVTDSGEGIPPDALERIFTKFEQADRRTHTKYGGSGLGLYISRELAEMQGGCIGIDSTVGVGSTFAFFAKVRRSEEQLPSKFLPLKHDHHPQMTVPTTLSPNMGDQPISPNPHPPKGHNILLVEDNILNQTVLAKQLRKAGCNVQISCNGGEAVDIVLQLHHQPAEFGSPLCEDALPYFDCILMDWEMPVCDGIQATKIIRNIEARLDSARSLIIGITANARVEQQKKAIAAGMDGVVPKPFRVAELLIKIAHFRQ